ncbi:MAG TPA: hypothetical protein PKC13_28380, partial [Blastocatellia bacterium]|nr:hypothetical protein [Blastocatellia bacterium]
IQRRQSGGGRQQVSRRTPRGKFSEIFVLKFADFDTLRILRETTRPVKERAFQQTTKAAA